MQSKTHFSIINVLYFVSSRFYNFVGSLLYNVVACNTIPVKEFQAACQPELVKNLRCMTRRQRRENGQPGDTEGVFARLAL